MRKPNWDLEKAVILRQQGWGYKEIAKELGQKQITINGYFIRVFGRDGINATSAKRAALTQIQLEVLFGSLLGDAALHINTRSKNKNADGKIEHSEIQKEYVLWKHAILENLSSSVKDISRVDKRTNKTYYSTRFRLLSNPALTEVHSWFYKPEGKTVPENLALLTPLAIAVWFMDDGFKSNNTVSLATNSFSIPAIKLLQGKLEEYEISSTVNKRNVLRIRKSSYPLFYKLVKPHMLDSLMYKLPQVDWFTQFPDSYNEYKPKPLKAV